MRLFINVALCCLVWILAAAFLHDTWKSKERQHLTESTAVLATTYRASVEMYRLATATLFEEAIQRPEIIETFAQGVQNTGALRDQARGRLYRLLAPTYAHLRQHGIRQFHFHTADGHSFLRFHAPDKCDDPLFDIRPTVRLANTMHRAVSGFEAGRTASGFRYVFPISQGDEHLGSVETSVTFRSIREAMANIDPSREYALVLRRELIGNLLFEERRALYGSSPLNDDFLVEDPLLKLPDSPPPPTATVRHLDARLKKDPVVRKNMVEGQTFAVLIATETGDWAVSFVPIKDILGQDAAYLVSYAKAPYAATLRYGFSLDLGLITLTLGIFVWFIQRLMKSRVTLRQEKQQLQTITDTIADGLYVMDTQGVIVRVNPAFSDLLGYDADEIVGRVGHERFHVHGDGNQHVPLKDCPICAAMDQGEGYAGEELFRRKDGGLLTVEVFCQPIRKDDRCVGAVAAFRDISERKVSDQRLRYLAQYDTLTSLPNRTLLLDRLQQAIVAAQREGEKFALLFLDLDHFKTINDSLGHLVGDKLLQQTATRLTDCVRSSDTVSRQGGDEFVVVLLQIKGPSDPAHVARKIIDAVARPYHIDGQELRLTASIGIALYPEDGVDTATLIKNADTAMYHAKKNGRDNYQYFTADLNARACERLALENSLRRALEHQEFLLRYQPLVDLESGRILGVEALLRWRHPELGLVAPDRFIAVAEDCGLILPIGEWVLREACRQNKAWQEAKLPPIPVAVNLSPLQFQQKNLVESIRLVLDEFGLDAEHLELELTEQMLMDGANTMFETLHRFKEMGVRIAIDDFGTGYSSLSYLRLFPIDKLKIDRSFVRDVASNPDDAAIASAIIAMARRLGLRVIAEGVETLDQRDFLLREGCREAQGYHYSEPLSAAAMADLLRASQSLPQPPASLNAS